MNRKTRYWDTDPNTFFAGEYPVAHPNYIVALIVTILFAVMVNV